MHPYPPLPDPTAPMTVPAQSQAQSGATPQQARQLFEYLKEFTQLKYRPDRIVRAPSAPAVRLRGAGPRKLTDIPPSELAELLSRLVAATPELGAGPTDALYRAALSVYGSQRLTEQARKTLEHAQTLDLSAGG
ncbi:hypothetical protein DESA109040_21180 [Deinococcus saxicola]|uniref:hypothetical protein n=1 Tax=Deinococcus saxicola TaxID=249406 RepID=UPI0039EE41CC